MEKNKTKPLVAIVGRPNVGKSTFFNKIIGKRLSIVNDESGVTRDRLYADAEWCGFTFTLVDTGGLELKSDDAMWGHIKKQAETAIDLADVILFFTDAKQGLLASDYDIADILRRSKKPVILVVNKADNQNYFNVSDFYALGMGEPFAISSEQSLGFGDLLDKITSFLKERFNSYTEEEGIKIAVVGRPNAGKSSLVNRLLGYDRVIVSDKAGTTRDAIDTPFEKDGKKFILIDTAGIRRKRSVDKEVEYYSVIRAFDAIRRADVVLMVMDATQNISEQDIRICGYIHEQSKPSVIIMNKWDIVEKDNSTVTKFNKELNEKLKFMSYFETLFVSALSGQRTDKITDKVIKVYDNASRRITTGLLNEVLQEAVSASPPPIKSGKRLKIFYASQTGICPPTIVIFVNDKEAVHFSYERYIENSLRTAFDFSGTPVKIIFRNKNDKESD